jgi:hypothetical protein
MASYELYDVAAGGQKLSIPNYFYTDHGSQCVKKKIGIALYII